MLYDIIFYLSLLENDSHLNYLLFIHQPKTGYIFVVGDNEEHSLDSRDENIGWINPMRVAGEVILYEGGVWWRKAKRFCKSLSACIITAYILRS